ncbi:MAG: hypothetical protein ACHQ50_07780 [Fimbriimonadales bacterium]
MIPPNRNWTPNRHNFHNPIYISIDIWAPTRFGYGGSTYEWNPSAWQYWMDDSLMEIVYKSERMSNSMRDSFERQMSQNDLRSSPGGQTAWDRVQRMDESLEKLRSQAGYFPESVMRESAIETLSLAQQVANSFNRHPNLRYLVSDQWDDLQFELNELARYYGEPTIR